MQVALPGEWFLLLQALRTLIYLLAINVFVWAILYESYNVFRQLMGNRHSEHLSELEISNDVKLAKKIRNRGIIMFLLLLAGIGSLSSTIRSSLTAKRWEVEIPSGEDTLKIVVLVLSNARFCLLYTGMVVCKESIIFTFLNHGRFTRRYT